MTDDEIKAARARAAFLAKSFAHYVDGSGLAVKELCRDTVPELLDENERLRAALTKISAIRDSIVGKQGFNFSEHAYPLVAALDAAGFKGAGYEIARANLGTLIEQRDRAEAERDALRADNEQLRSAIYHHEQHAIEANEAVERRCAEVERMRPVYEAAKAIGERKLDGCAPWPEFYALKRTVDAALASEAKDPK